MSTNEELHRIIEQLRQEKEQERREKEQARRDGEQARRDGEQARRDGEQARRLIRNTTLEEYLAACQEHVLSKIQLVTDGYLTTRAPTTNPARKHCPTLLVPWAGFISTQIETIRLIDRVLPDDGRLFESLHFLQGIGHRLSMRRVQDEASLVFVQNNAIEDPVRIILSKMNAFHPTRFGLSIPDQVEFQTTASSLRDPTDQRDTVERDARLRTDQICVFRNSAQRDIAYVIEYKAPHKLHTAHLEQGLRQMDIFREVVNKQTIPTADPDKFKHYAELLSAAAVTQTYHYMLEAGLEYSYLTNGDAIVFLKIDWADPAVLHYHLAQPSREVLVDGDAAYSNAICQVLAFTLTALQSRQHTNSERVAATEKCQKWEVDFGFILDQIVKEEEEEKARADPTTPRGRKHSRATSSPGWLPAPIKKTRRNPRQQSPSEESDRVLRSHGHDRPGGGAGTGGGASEGDRAGRPDGSPQRHGTAASSDRAPTGGESTYQGRRQYCTPSCLLSLVGGQLSDQKCPNVELHLGTTLPEAGQARQARHPVSYSQFMDLLRRQFAQGLDEGVVVLGKEGACGALFQITLLRYGYTFIAKGVTGGRVPELEKEAAVYQKLQPLQGHGIPVCLGSVDLKPLGQVFYYYFDVRIIRFILLSYGGTEVRAGDEASRAGVANTVTSILGQMHRLGVVHGDVRWPNVLQGPDGEITLIDFDRATFLLPDRSRAALSAISPNRRKRLMEAEGGEDSSPAKKAFLQPAIQQDNADAQSLFSLDCGRMIGRGGLGRDGDGT
ncbi:hypothetical protein GMORB2_6159 [Geosmithia morbida]|uniref:Protein kinase domain-containing protein n=1 Tax=Geosmithia morbida TaxID=1094350 RepID=A0A9P4YUQ6_9HYPO|nr:uncharacterized protein GMORB2_6159 [Geosmithia morbida]KAF4123458.1 hypothetical protein GMORB2_6159 [Geosmithia morbida]